MIKSENNIGKKIILLSDYGSKPFSLYKFPLKFILIVFFIVSIYSCNHKETEPQVANKPLYRDTIYDGAADPVVIWNKNENKWFMFYTNRRAKLADTNLKDVSWVHGTPIGIAESSDGGASWSYKCDAKIKYGGDSTTYWAPEVIYHNNLYHMYLTIVPGIYSNWKHPRYIIHLISKNLIDWDFVSKLSLNSEKVIDACVFQLPDKTWRMWYNNEKDHKSIYYADSPDLYAWTDKGKISTDTRERGEGPKVFSWNGRYFMVIDEWKGLGIYTSKDLLNWTRQKNRILDTPGSGKEDNIIGHHADVVISNNKAFIFYFTHPGRAESYPDKTPYELARSSIQVAELEYSNEEITCNRNNPVNIKLTHKK